MESSKKRKGPPGSTPSSSEGSATKKIRLLNTHHGAPTKNKVQEVGERLLVQLRKARDKTDREIATLFLELPDREELPDYYEVIKLPVALSTIEAKLKRNEYPTISTIESDLKRMVQNAKDYNDPKSEVYQDAERIRKLVFNFMKANNPDYKIPGYSAVATPLPQIESKPVPNGTHADSDVAEVVESRDGSEKRSVALKSSVPPSDRMTSVAPSATTGDPDGGEAADEDLDFTGKTFQEAQQAIITYLLNYTDEEGLQIYTPFGNLPSRKLEDYYKVIRHPVSLRSILKRCHGQHGRHEVTGVTDFKTWDAFEEEISFIWRNAQEYNEDGSEMFLLADAFKEHFETLLAEAREKVEEPSSTRIKLAGPKPKVTLNFSQHRNSPAPGVTIDNDALQRQKQVVAAGVNGCASRPLSASNGPVKSLSQGPSVEPTSQATHTSPPGTVVKAEKVASQSPAPNNVAPAVQPATNGMMPPPPMRPSSGSPFPHQPPAAVNSYTFTAPSLLPPPMTRAYPVELALLPLVTVSTHPQLAIPKRFSLSITPHATLAHQSTTITLPTSHYFLQIAPTISKQLSMGRPYKMFVTVNGTRLNQRDTQFHVDTGKRTHVYEGSLAQGVNRIEVEVAASKLDAGNEDGNGKGLDVEKVTVYANLMRA
ncbi:hypothetical protein M433DRAFT_139084 [Acidomyces richmondensis BFW]|nr:MAG: hypothetical protein FE78DRAFT_35382 [Acidomyces sp. 'richmondensis']KYG50543.1 hypothetical protein M433DRAFT_139084 [Acidomyces richmondensis BFW]